MHLVDGHVAVAVGVDQKVESLEEDEFFDVIRVLLLIRLLRLLLRLLRLLCNSALPAQLQRRANGSLTQTLINLTSGGTLESRA